jgi:hypothetical protein
MENGKMENVVKSAVPHFSPSMFHFTFVTSPGTVSRSNPPEGVTGGSSWELAAASRQASSVGVTSVPGLGNYPGWLTKRVECGVQRAGVCNDEDDTMRGR